MRIDVPWWVWLAGGVYALDKVATIAQAVAPAVASSSSISSGLSQAGQDFSQASDDANAAAGYAENPLLTGPVGLGLWAGKKIASYF